MTIFPLSLHPRIFYILFCVFRSIHRDYHNDSAYKSMRGSSDSSSAYSGSDTMQSMQYSGSDTMQSRSSGSAGSAGSGDVEEVDLTGLMESVVDSDEEVFIFLVGQLLYSSRFCSKNPLTYIAQCILYQSI